MKIAINISISNVSDPRWVGYQHTGYSGRQYILEEGEYPDSSSWKGANDQLSSLKKLDLVSRLGFLQLISGQELWALQGSQFLT